MKLLLASGAALALAAPAVAQDEHAGMDHGSMNMPGMDHGGTDHSQHGDTDEDAGGDEPSNIRAFTSLTDALCFGGDDRGNYDPDQGIGCTKLPGFAEGSGTSRLPGNEAGMHGLHLMAGDWMLMAHGQVTAQYTNHSGPRGDEMLYSTSMLMLMAERNTGWGRIQLRSMLSAEPLMNARGYPNLFASGETAGGAALVDRQHPHDLFMELAARVDVDVGQSASLFLYGGPVGEPAIGPSAFMHRRSAANNPEPPISHHWFDSTHITYGVVTGGLAMRHFQLEASAFRGEEPDEERWNIETPKLDSWAVRATWNPDPRWAMQASYAELNQPELLHPNEDERRFTTSVNYTGDSIAAMVAFSAKNRVPGDTLTAWLGEVNWDLDEANSLFGRVENVENDELFPDHLHPLHDQAFRVTKFQLGYARHFELGDVAMLTLGASGSAYAKPGALDLYYGKNPLGFTVFAKLALGH